MENKTTLPTEVKEQLDRKLNDLRSFMRDNGIRIAYDTSSKLHRFAFLPDGFWPLSREDKDFDPDSAEYDLGDFTQFEPDFILIPFDPDNETIQKL